MRKSKKQLCKEQFIDSLRMQQAKFFISQKGLATATGITESTLSRKLKNPDALTVAELRAIIGLLEMDESTVLSYLGY